ncbi:MAG TPA: MFS transporter [Pseudolysinimonas sp.]|nr:MFS transporter [Pseudolysinimonas sp.]
MPRPTISSPATPRAFPLLWGGTASANLADGITLAIAPLLAAAITRDPALVAALVVAQRLPWFLFVLFSGVIVDRFDRRLLLVLGNLVRFVALGMVTVALGMGVRELWILYIAAFLLGCAETVVDNASLAILPQLIRRDRIQDANGRIFATQSILNELVGPPLGALIFALSAVASFASGSAAFLLATVIYFMLPRRVRDDAPSAVASQSVWKSVGEGIRIFGRTPILIVMAGSAAVMNFCTSGTSAILVLFAQDRLGLNDAGYGLLLAAAAIGGIPAGLVGPAIIRRAGEGPVWIGSTLAAGLGFGFSATTTSSIVVAVVWAVTNFGFTLGNIIAISVRQTAIPNEMLGRVTSVYRLLAVGVMPLGALVGGLVASAFGLAAPFWVAGAGMVMLAIVTAPYIRTARIRRITGGADQPAPDAPPVAGASSE